MEDFHFVPQRCRLSVRPLNAKLQTPEPKPGVWLGEMLLMVSSLVEGSRDSDGSS